MASMYMRFFSSPPSPPPTPLTNPRLLPISSSMENILPFPGLPIELILHIFELAASDSHRTANSISLVSTWARKLVLPSLFSTIVYRCKPAFSEGMSSGYKESPHSRTYRTHEWGHLVRNLWSESIGMANTTMEGQILNACPNVENLALVSGSFRTLASLTQVQNAILRKQLQFDADACSTPSSSPHPEFLARLREITVISPTFRYDWHFLVGLRLPDGSELLHNITHVRITTCAPLSFSPHNLLPNVSHLALPYLEMGNHFNQEEPLRLPPGLLECRSLRMIVLTVDADTWLQQPPQTSMRYQPWKKPVSPKAAFRAFVKRVTKGDDRLHVVLSPHQGVDLHDEWVASARGSGLSLWEAAEKARKEDSHGEGLPDAYPEQKRH